MELKSRKCPIEIKLVPYGGGWTDVYLYFGDKEIYLIISNVVGGDDFSTLIKTLCYLDPDYRDTQTMFDLAEEKDCICEYDDTDTTVVKGFAEKGHTNYNDENVRSIPWKTSFCWDGEGSGSRWVIERVLSDDGSFMIKVHITSFDGEDTHDYEYIVRFEDMCYAVAKAATRALKRHGIYGFHVSTYTDDINIRELLYLKCKALDNYEVRELSNVCDMEHGSRSNLKNELELLLFDM